jgi:mono/diheme cytochrome c family protein
MKQRLALVCLAALFTVSVLSAHGAEKAKHPVDLSKIPPAADKKDVTYSNDIKPIFENSCVKCHGAQKPKAKLRLDSLEGALKGGEDGKVILPGKGAESLLVQNVANVGDPDQYMPPPKNKANIGPLTKEQIGLLRAWIDQGAK